MDQTLTRNESKELMQLLELQMDAWGNMPLMKRQYLQKCKVFHPDKGGDENKMKRLTELWDKLCTTLQEVHTQNVEEDNVYNVSEMPTYGTEEWNDWWEKFNEGWEEILRCDEEVNSRSPSPTPHSSTAYTPPSKQPKTTEETPPKQQPEMCFPECLNEFCSQAVFSNKTLTCFVIQTTENKSKEMYVKLQKKFKTTFASRHKYMTVCFVFMLTCKRHRVSAVHNYVCSQCTFSKCITKGVINIYGLYSYMCREPFAICEESVNGGLKQNQFEPEDLYGEKVEQFNLQMLSEYACAIKCDDAYILLGLYLQFTKPVAACEHCISKQVIQHYKYHAQQQKNAELFKQSKQQKNMCQQAVDCVIAERRLNLTVMSRKQQLLQRFIMHFEHLEAVLKGEPEINLYMAGVAWFMTLEPGIDDIIMKYLQCVVDNIPKKRYWVFKGPVNSGKTTLASALLDLVGGKALNINLPWDRISFELGCAIDQFSVVFEDVKGVPENHGYLDRGQGMEHLDNLRDYLDGAVPVNLEKKHSNKKSQIFPPGIITMNQYEIPKTVQMRICFFKHFTFKKHLTKALQNTPEIMKYRVLNRGITLLLLLIWARPVSDFMPEIQAKVVYWKETIEQYVSLSKFADFRVNCEQGIDIYTDTDAEHTQVSQESEVYNTQE
ncbi:large T antigen [Rabbit polyomavirus]|nr:large T antigen [Rabbit polyomavirus]